MTTALLIATRNPGKAREIRAVLKDLPCELAFLHEMGLAERTAEATLELADSFEGNALRKAQYFAKLTGAPTAAEDSGLEVFALGGLPGVQSRRFAMSEGSREEQDAANNAELLRRLGGLPGPRRRARYRCVVAYLPRPDAAPVTFEGTCTGSILEEPQGTGGFGYDPVFLSDELQQSFGQAAPAEKDSVSHRGRAFRAFAEWLRTNPVPIS